MEKSEQSVETSAPALAEGAEALIAAAEQIGYAQGVSGITTRALARDVGRSLSSVGYHFGRQEEILTALYAKLSGDTSRWRTERLQNLKAAQAVFLEPAPTVAHLLADITGPCRSRVLLMADIEDMTMRGLLNNSAAVVQEHTAMNDFWLDVMNLWQCPVDEAELWAAIARGSLLTMLVEPDPVVRGTAFSVFTQRLAERLQGRPPSSVHPAPQPIPLLADENLEPRGKRLIIEAAMRLIGEKGLSQITHRDIAAAAGVSVASTTYFFKDKGEIILAAFHELLRRITAAHTDPSPDSKAFANAVFTEADEVGWEANAIMAWYLAAARDPELLSTVRIVQIHYWGIAVWPILEAHGVHGADRVDGMLATFISNCAIADCRPEPQGQRAAYLTSRMKRDLTRLFGKTQ